MERGVEAAQAGCLGFAYAAEPGELSAEVRRRDVLTVPGDAAHDGRVDEHEDVHGERAHDFRAG